MKKKKKNKRFRASAGLADPVAQFSSCGQEPRIGATTKKRYPTSHVSAACVVGRSLDSGGSGLPAATEQTMAIKWRNEMVRISSFFLAVIDSKESAMELGSRWMMVVMISHMGVDRCRTVVSFQDKGDEMSQDKATRWIYLHQRRLDGDHASGIIVCGRPTRDARGS
ncbi:hypothetical protein NE237_018071 [Protea cynaroides]|uniref:Uncharacterized protein n=1 Tax=Protea cynaroides TaxID=273540 RepID=A0A9Q0QNM8_9MAGN|nr:hypothetical protein NE237_018071 [Protea cynaroides]